MPPKGANLEQTKAHNLRLVLSEILSGDEISRADIAKRTGLTRQTISNLVDKLIHSGFIMEGDFRKSGAGKPSRILHVSPTSAYSLGIRIEPNHIDISLADITGELSFSDQIKAKYKSNDELISLIEPLCLDIIRKAGVDIQLLLGIGIIMAEKDDRNAADQELQEIDPKVIAEGLYQELNIPTLLETAAAAAALAEFTQGSARNFKNFIYLFIGEQLSAGLMIDGRIYGGRSSRAGSIGHLVVDINGPICSCGNPGCLNGYISLDALRKHLSTPQKKVISSANPFDGIQEHNPIILSWLEKQAEHFRVGINSLENLYDPETIILGGDCPDWFLEETIRAARPFMRSVSEKGDRDLPRVIRSPDAENLVIKGAATLPIYAALGDENTAYKSHIQYGIPFRRLSELLDHYITTNT